ncbi:MAG: relaxase/mobilization nuclease domain-containing protein [Bacilli bacterium]
MSIIKVHALKGNVQSAINYIVNKDKVAAGCVGSFGVNIQTAGMTWNLKKQNKNTNNNFSSFDDVTGYHFIQSFPPESISPEEANDMAREWIDKVLQNNYDYVIATHVNQQHIHTHIIVNSMNNTTGKNMDLFFRRDIPLFRKLNDEVCVAHGKETIETNNKYSKPYYEWMKKNQGDTYKDIVRKTIDDIIPKVKNINEFVLYLRALGFEVEIGDEEKNNNKIKEDKSFKFSVNEKLIIDAKETSTHYFIRIPSSKEYIYVPKENAKFTTDGKTLFIEVNLNDQLDYYDSNYQVLKQVKGSDIKKNFENKGKEDIVRNGLRIKPVGSNKFIRCKRFDENENGEGYSFENIKERIENNGRYISDPDIQNFIAHEYTKQQKDKNKERYYQNMNFKEGFRNSKYTVYTPKERYIYMKMKSINANMDAIREINHKIASSKLKGKTIETVKESITDLKKQKLKLIDEIDEINELLKTKENDCEEIIQKRIEGTLIISNEEFDEYVETFLTPLRNNKALLIEEIQTINTRIQEHDKKQQR